MTENKDFKGCFIAPLVAVVSRHSEPLGERIQLMLKSISEKFCLKSFKTRFINHENKPNSWIAMQNPSPAFAVPTSHKRYSIVCSAEFLTREAVHVIKEKAAFTLSEVLITLGIIGVVAAMTMPSLITNYQKKVLQTQLAKTYSVLAQSIKLSENENGDLAGWSIFNPIENSDEGNRNFTQQMADYFIPYMQSVIATDYKVYILNSIYGPNIHIKTLSGRETNMTTPSYLVILNDGTIVSFDHVNWVSVMPTIFVDINGKKGPNQWGKDIFYFQLTKQSGLRAYNYYNWSREEILEQDCSKTKDGRNCAVLLEMNNWEFPKDYPW